MECGVYRYEDVNGYVVDVEFFFSEVFKYELYYCERIVFCLWLVCLLFDFYNIIWLWGDWGVEDIWVYGKLNFLEL